MRTFYGFRPRIERGEWNDGQSARSPPHCSSDSPVCWSHMDSRTGCPTDLRTETSPANLEQGGSTEPVLEQGLIPPLICDGSSPLKHIASSDPYPTVPPCSKEACGERPRTARTGCLIAQNRLTVPDSLYSCSSINSCIAWRLPAPNQETLAVSEIGENWEDKQFFCCDPT